MTALITPADAMKLPLLRRRPALDVVMSWVNEAVWLGPNLDPSSQQLLSRICAVAWQVFNTWRATDATSGQPVTQQAALGKAVAVLRQVSVVYGRYYVSSQGATVIALLPAGVAALTNLEGWDVIGAPTFDIDSALLTLVTSMRVQ